MKNSPLITTLTENVLGRDFVVGDVNGQHDMLMQSLSLINFDPEKDRLFAVGNVINKGNENVRTMQLFKEPWFFSVLGLQELILLSYFHYYHSKYFKRLDPNFYRYIKWFQTIPLEQAQDCVKIIKEHISILPSVIRIKKGDFWHYIVSGDLSKGKNGYSVFLFTDDEIEKLTHFNKSGLDWESFSMSERLYQESLYSHLDDYKDSKNQEQGLGTVYCGNSIVDTPYLYRNHIFLNTGAVYSGKLSILEIGAKIE
jgi:serine/threonine protein phosphatase 1